jgi:hypothetical protein
MRPRIGRAEACRKLRPKPETAIKGAVAQYKNRAPLVVLRTRHGPAQESAGDASSAIGCSDGDWTEPKRREGSPHARQSGISDDEPVDGGDATEDQIAFLAQRLDEFGLARSLEGRSEQFAYGRIIFGGFFAKNCASGHGAGLLCK